MTEKEALLKKYEEVKDKAIEIVLYISMPTGETEIISNPNAAAKIEYIKKTYNADLVHNNCDKIRIVDYAFTYGCKDYADMEQLKMPLLGEKYTKIYHEQNYKHNAPNQFVVANKETGEGLAWINFQTGPIKEHGVNGIHNEDLINMVICRLQHFQDSEFSCRENSCAITKLEEALMWLRMRTDKRIARGVEGTHTV